MTKTRKTAGPHLLYGVKVRQRLKSTKRTLEAIVKDGLLEQELVREPLQGAYATMIRYGLLVPVQLCGTLTVKMG